MQSKLVLSHRRMRKRAADEQDRKGLDNNYSIQPNTTGKQNQKQNLWPSPSPASKGQVRKEPRPPPWLGCSESPSMPSGCCQRRPRKEPTLSSPLVSVEIIWEPGIHIYPSIMGRFSSPCTVAPSRKRRSPSQVPTETKWGTWTSSSIWQSITRQSPSPFHVRESPLKQVV